MAKHFLEQRIYNKIKFHSGFIKVSIRSLDAVLSKAKMMDVHY